MDSSAFNNYQDPGAASSTGTRVLVTLLCAVVLAIGCGVAYSVGGKSGYAAGLVDGAQFPDPTVLADIEKRHELVTAREVAADLRDDKVVLTDLDGYDPLAEIKTALVLEVEARRQHVLLREAELKAEQTIAIQTHDLELYRIRVSHEYRILQEEYKIKEEEFAYKARVSAGLIPENEWECKQ